MILSRRAIEELWALDGSNGLVHLPLQLLAQGFERLLKLTYALAWMKQHGELPATKTFRNKFGHHIGVLTDALVDLVATQQEYTARPTVQDDLEFIRSDPQLRSQRSHLDLLSTFGTWSRYYRFEEFLGAVNDEKDDPERTWERMEMEILKSVDGGMALLGDPRHANEVQQLLNERITSVLERFARAITRMWTLGALHPEAKRLTGIIGDFLFIHDRDLGTDPSQRRRRR